MSVRWMMVVVVAVAVGCAPAAPSMRRDANLITQSEIVNSQAANLYDAITRIRPAFLRTRGPTSISNPGGDYPIVYLDNQRYGDIEALKGMSPVGVLAIRYFNAADATTRFGMGHVGGVIEVITR